MLRNFAFVAAAGGLPPSGSVLCIQCARPMVADPVSGELSCAPHSYVVAFSGDKRHSVWFDDLRLLAMKHPSSRGGDPGRPPPDGSSSPHS